MPTAWKTVRVFISSTFRDMHAERDHLVRFVFPRLREQLLPRRIHLLDVDLRWGVTSEQDASEVCREVITECRPRFLCMLGGRYGTIPEHEALSITDDEVHFGVLDVRTEKIYGLFYFRHGAVTEQMDKSSPGAIREPRRSDKARKLARLKRDIHAAKHRPVLYRPRWSADEQRLLDLKAFGDRVACDLLATIDDEFGVQPATQLDEFAEENAAIEAFLEERAERFVLGSREKVLNDLLAHATARDGNNHVCLTGAPGSGKSALLAHLSKHSSLKDPILLVRHFVGASPGSTDVRRTLRRLCYELKANCPAITADIPDDLEKLRVAWFDFLRQASSHKRVVILLDAINQFDAASHSAGLHWLPEELPANVCIILSALDGPALDCLRRRRSKPCEIELDPLTADDGQAIIQQFSKRYRKELESDQRADLLAKPDAVTPLYLLAALEELRTLGTRQEITRRIAELPPTTAELFAWILRRLENDDGFRDASSRRTGHELVPKFASLLAASRHGLSQRELTDLLAPSDPLGNVAALLHLLRPYLMRRGELLDFYHTQFRSVPQTYLLMAEQKDTAHASLATYFNHAERSGASWRGALSRHLIEFPYHLWRSGGREPLFALAHNEEFLSAQQESVPERPDLPFQTLRFALNTACAAEDPVRMAEFTMNHAYRLARQHSQTIPDVMLDTTLPVDVALPRAWGLADAFEPRLRALALLMLGWKLKVLGHLNEAAATLRKLDEACLANGGQYQPLIELLSIWLEPEFDSSRWTPALLGGEEISTGNDTTVVSDERLEKLASTLASLGHFASAKRLAAQIRHNERSEKVKALSAIANAQAQADMFADATATAADIENSWSRAMTLTDIAVAQAHAGQEEDSEKTFAQALTAAALIDPWFSGGKEATDKIVASVATVQAHSGQFAKAFETARGIKSSWSYADALKAIAAALAEMGRIGEALATVKGIYDAQQRARALLAIATVQAQWGGDPAPVFAEALGAGGGVRDELWRATVYRDIATLQAQAGRFIEAIDTATMIEDALPRADAFSAIAVEQTKIGHNAAASFASALAAAEADKFDRRSYSLYQITLAQTQAGLFTDAQATVAEIEDRKYQSWALSAISTAQARADLLADAQTSLMKIHHALSRSDAFVSLAIIEARAGRNPDRTFAQALATASTLEDEADRNRGLSTIAKAQMQTGQDPTRTFATALTAAARLKDVGCRQHALHEVTVVQAQVGRFADAISTAMRIRAEWLRVRSLVIIAREQAKVGLAPSQAFAEALTLAAGMDTQFREDAYLEIAIAQVQTCCFDEALATSAKVNHSLQEIASAQTQAGRFADALAITDRIDFTWERAETLGEIATAQAYAGQFGDALATLARAKAPSERAEVLGILATIKVQAGQNPSQVFAEALKVAGDLNENGMHDLPFRQIALAQARGGQFAAALTTTAQVKDLRPKTLSAIAMIQAETDLFDEAIETAAHIDCAYFRAQAMTGIAVLQTQSNRDPTQTFSYALATAEELEEAWIRADVFSKISTAQAQVGRFEDALETAAKIELPETRLETLQRIASAQASRGNLDAALSIYDMTLTAQVEGLNGIGSAIANLPDRSEARSVLDPYLVRAAHYVSSSWHACSVIASLYPGQATELATFLTAVHAS